MTSPTTRCILSRHRTTEGTLVYARRADGGLQVWLERSPETLLLTEGGPCPATPPGPAADGAGSATVSG